MMKTLLAKLKTPLSKIDFWVIAVLLASVLVLIINIVAIQTVRPFNSDDVVTQVLIHDHRVTDGQGTMWFGEDNFVIKMLYYLLTEFLFTNSRAMIIATVIIFDVIGFVLFYFSALYFLKRFKVKDRFALLTMVWLASCYNIVWYFLMNPNLRNVEIGINFAVLAVLAKYIDGDFKFNSWPKKILVVVLAGLLGIFFYSDPFFTFMLGIPFLLFCVWHYFWQKSGRRAVIYSFFFMLASIATTFLWEKFFAHFFDFSLKRASTAFATISDMAQSTRQLVWDYFFLYWADFWNKPLLSFTQIRASFNAILVISSIVVPVVILFRQRRKTDPWLLFMLGMPLFIGAIFIASHNTVASGFPAIRFLALLPFYAIFAYTLVFREITNEIVKKILLGVLILATLLNVASLTRSIFVKPTSSPNANNLTIASVLQDNNVSKGYGHNWDNSINSYLSDNHLKIIRIECFTKIYWLMDDGNELIQASKTFYIYNTKYSQNCSQDQVFAHLGDPSKIIPIDNEITVFIYDYDIGNRFNVFIPK